LLRAGPYTHLEIYWELPAFRRYCERLAEFTRLVLFDKRGMGMSDRVPGATTLEECMDDVRAVMDAVGSERAAVMGESEGGPLAMLFAAAHPERTVALILQGGEVRERTDEEWPWGESTEEEFESAMATLPERLGKVLGVSVIAPSVAGQEWARAWRARVPSTRIRPARPKPSCAWRSTSTCAVAPAINVPTLIVHTTGDKVCHVRERPFSRPHHSGSALGRAARGGSRSLVRARRHSRRDS
jgi:pimeloyl-ACP methyl ester carboxylesterase